MTYSFQVGPIRPPSEAYSLLIRATLNCPWNRCQFCPVYKGEKFSIRMVEEVKRDIQTAKDISDEIKYSAWRMGRGNQLEEAAARAYREAPNDSFRQVALWLYFGGEAAFLQDANKSSIKPSVDRFIIVSFCYSLDTSTATERKDSFVSFNSFRGLLYEYIVALTFYSQFLNL